MQASFTLIYLYFGLNMQCHCTLSVWVRIFDSNNNFGFVLHRSSPDFPEAAWDQTSSKQVYSWIRGQTITSLLAEFRKKRPASYKPMRCPHSRDSKKLILICGRGPFPLACWIGACLAVARCLACRLWGSCFTSGRLSTTLLFWLAKRDR